MLRFLWPGFFLVGRQRVPSRMPATWLNISPYKVALVLTFFSSQSKKHLFQKTWTERLISFSLLFQGDSDKKTIMRSSFISSQFSSERDFSLLNNQRDDRKLVWPKYLLSSALWPLKSSCLNWLFNFLLVFATICIFDFRNSSRFVFSLIIRSSKAAAKRFLSFSFSFEKLNAFNECQCRRA